MEENTGHENIENNLNPTEPPAQAETVKPEAVEPEKVVEAPVEAAVEVKADEIKAEEKVESVEKAPLAPPVGERKWYVVQTFTGQEDKAKSALEQMVKDEGLGSRIFQILVPIEETVEIKGGKRVEKTRKMFPGYVFLDMILDEQTWYFIRQTNGVARFIGTKVNPTPVSEKEMQRVLKQLGKEEKLEVSFERGEGVRVISGPFRGYTGSVDEINAEKGKLKVLINIFGRDTPVEVNFEHAQKIS
ncbi:MAG: transcription termination/antitermination protein NusG [Candidatus Margulisbacteria bacterium]|nr:transcription termination/antitermination protein NusG [Candidatus Margulisiibacteriota bacterium]